MRQQLGAAPSRTYDDVTKTYVDSAISAIGGGTPVLLEYDTGTSAWPARPDVDQPVIFIGGTAPDDAPSDVDLTAGDYWLPQSEPGGTTDGPSGGAGPPNSLSIGTVTSGSAGATITGTAPSQTLNLVLPAYTPPFILLTPAAGVSNVVGGGLNGEMPGILCNAGAVTPVPCFGWAGPWDTVDVWIAWAEQYNATTGGTWLCSTYVHPFTPTEGLTGGGAPISGPISMVAAGVKSQYYETLVASSVSVYANGMVSVNPTRQGTTSGDNDPDRIAILGVILRPSA